MVREADEQETAVEESTPVEVSTPEVVLSVANTKVEGVSTEELEEEPTTDKTCPVPDCGRKFPNAEML